MEKKDSSKEKFMKKYYTCYYYGVPLILNYIFSKEFRENYKKYIVGNENLSYAHRMSLKIAVVVIIIAIIVIASVVWQILNI